MSILCCRYVHINEIWDRVEKVLILLIDAGLNWYFVRVVKKQLVEQGLKKYDALVRFNVRIILISLAMDVRSPAIPGLLHLPRAVIAPKVFYNTY